MEFEYTGYWYVSEEDLNRMLLGTGMEIYNPSSGVEVFGLEYNKKSGFDYLAASDSNKKMTLSDVRKFRNKEKEMRIEDLTEYAYTVSEKTLNNSGEKSIIYELDAPITDYENTYMKIWFEIKDDKIKMQVPQLIYRNDHCFISTGCCFFFFVTVCICFINITCTVEMIVIICPVNGI